MAGSRLIEPAHPLFRLVFSSAFDENEVFALNVGTGKERAAAGPWQKALEASVLNLWIDIVHKIMAIPVPTRGRLDIDPVHVAAARTGNIAAMKIACNLGLTDFSISLSVAAEQGQIEAMQEVVRGAKSMGIDSAALYLNGALCSAARGGRIAAMREARALGATDFDQALMTAADNGRLDAMREARDMWATSSDWDDTPRRECMLTSFDRALDCAALRGHIETVREALAMGATIDTTTLTCAAEKGRIAIMRELRAVANSRGVILDFSRILSAAAISGQVDVMREVLAMSKEAKQTVDFDKALMYAAEFGYMATVREALAMGATKIAEAIYNVRVSGCRLEGWREIIEFLQSRL